MEKCWTSPPRSPEAVDGLFDQAGNEISLACAVNANYIPPLLVMLRSLLEHSSRPVRLYCLTRALSLELRARVETLVKTRWIQVDADNLPAALPVRTRLPLEAYFPLLLDRLLTVERVIFLDADLLVLDDIAPLWNADLQGFALGAVQDMAIPLVSSPRGVAGWNRLGLHPWCKYFNGGVMIMDLERWRALGISERALDYVRDPCNRVDFLHQDALNAILHGGWLSLPPRWNLLGSLAGRSFYHNSEPAYGEALDNPGIVHFAGRFKPWLVGTGGPFAPIYHRYMDHPPKSRSFYDCHLRPWFYWLERFCWERGWL